MVLITTPSVIESSMCLFSFFMQKAAIIRNAKTNTILYIFILFIDAT